MILVLHLSRLKYRPPLAPNHVIKLPGRDPDITRFPYLLIQTPVSIQDRPKNAMSFVLPYYFTGLGTLASLSLCFYPRIVRSCWCFGPSLSSVEGVDEGALVSSIVALVRK